MAARGGLVCRSHRDASREEVQQCPVWRSDWLRLLSPAVPLGTAHGGHLGLPGEAPSDALVPGRSGLLVCRVGCLGELRSLPGLQGDWRHQQGECQPLHGHRGRPGLSARPQPRHGSPRGGLLAGLHAGPHAGRLPACADSALARPALRRLRPAVSLLLPAGDAAPGEAGALRHPGAQSRRRPAQPPGPAPLLRRGPWPGPAHWRQPRPPAPPRPGLLPVPLPVLGPGVHTKLPRTPALPVQQPAAGEDVFLHRTHHGHHPGRLRPADQPRQRNRSCEAGHPAAGPRLPPHRLGAHTACAGPGAAALLLCCCCRGALPVFRGRRLWLAWAEGHGHGHAAEPGCPGQGGGAHGGRLSVLAGGGPSLLHRVLRALPAPLPPPADPAASGMHTQGRVAVPASPQAGQPRQEVRVWAKTTPDCDCWPDPFLPPGAQPRTSQGLSPRGPPDTPDLGSPACYMQSQGLQNLAGFRFACFFTLGNRLSARRLNDNKAAIL